jgi:hypothetical protein
MAAQGEHEALRYFRALSPDEKLENLWMGLRELNDLGQGMIQRQDRTNGTVIKNTKELEVHLEMHRMEVAEIGFLKRWGGRGNGLLVILISISTFVMVVSTRIWGG